VAHLFGGRAPLTPLIDLCRRHRLWLIEACAQAFDGRCHGDPPADASMFSFGAIKTSTAAGGAVLVVRNAAILDRLRRRLTTQGVQSRGAYSRRLLKLGLLKVVSTRRVFGAVAALSKLSGWDYDRLVNRSARGFVGGDFFTAIRKQPSAPWFALMARRLARFDFSRAVQRQALGRGLFAALRHAVDCSGLDEADHCFWVFPILCDDPRGMLDALRLAGFDATQGHSLKVVEGATRLRQRPGALAQFVGSHGFRAALERDVGSHGGQVGPDNSRRRPRPKVSLSPRAASET
jgi:dTDP-4-amino-4,6-dideoxygalactose transaminase